jgi:hypothetical protein
MTRPRGPGDFVRDITTTKSLQGIQTHLAFLVRYNWPERKRPSAMAVRTEDEIIDYVKQILEIRERAQYEHWGTYLKAEQHLLMLTKGKLPAAIRLRASYCYRTSPNVKLYEMLYAGNHSDHCSKVVSDWKSETGYGPAAFEEQLGEWELEQWRILQIREENWRAQMEKLAAENREKHP